MAEEEQLNRKIWIGMAEQQQLKWNAEEEWMNMKSQNHDDSFGYKQHMQNSLLLNNTIGNGCFATLQQQH